MGSKQSRDTKSGLASVTACYEGSISAIVMQTARFYWRREWGVVHRIA